MAIIALECLLLYISCVVLITTCANFELVQTNGKWCNDPRIETTVNPPLETQCQSWCKDNNYRYCMWDYGRADGFCMASYFCNSKQLAHDNRRYSVTENLNFLRNLRPWFPIEDSPGKWCDHDRLESNTGTEAACLRWCDQNKLQYCMWDYGRSDGFCMGSRSCVDKRMAEDDRRYRIWRNVKFISYTNPWLVYSDDGKWCDNTRDETTVRPSTEEQCRAWCLTKSRNYCMWDYGRSDGFCMASNACSNRRMAGDNRRYRVWVTESFVGSKLAPSYDEPGTCQVEAAKPDGHDELRIRRATQDNDDIRRSIFNQMRQEALRRTGRPTSEQHQFGAMRMADEFSATAYHPRYGLPGSAPMHSEELLLHVARERLLQHNGNVRLVFGNCRPVIYIWTEHSPCMYCTGWLTMFADEFPAVRVVIGFNHWLFDNLNGLRQLLGELFQPDNLDLYQYDVSRNNTLAGGSEI